MVKESIKQCGYVSPIVVDENYEILAGHTRYNALLQLTKNEEIDVLVCSGMTEEQKKKYRLLDNKTNEFASWDFDKLQDELEELDFNGFDFNFEEDINSGENYSPDEFGTDFNLPDGDKPEICQMTFTLHEDQKALIQYAIELIGDDVYETFGNTNKNGNALYEVIRQWAEQRK